MRLAYLIPTTQYAFLADLVPALEEAGIEVTVNRVYANTDLILAGILPITHEWVRSIRLSRAPFVLWHWDLYSFTDYTQPHWRDYLALLPQAAEVWSCGYEVARQLRECLELDSQVVPAWVDAPTLYDAGCGVIEDRVFYAAGGASIGKRLDWAVRACRLAGLPLVWSANQNFTPEQYLRVLARSRVYVMPAFEESNASIPALEAAAAGRAVVLADLPASREVFGETARYFAPWDFAGLVRQLKLAWQEGPLPGCRERIARGYDRSVIFPRIIHRLRRLHGDLQGRTR